MDPNEQKRNWMESKELDDFDRRRANGDLTFYRSAICVACGREIYKTKSYCSKKCRDDFEKEEEENNG